MGKYMKKSRPADVAVMEGYLGVRTRAKALALQQARKEIASVAVMDESLLGGYLELRTRKLAKIVKASSGELSEAEGSNFEAGEVQSPGLIEDTHNSASPAAATATAAAAGNNHNKETSNEDKNESDSCVQEQKASRSRPLRESHSESCLRKQAAAHSGSNSAKFALENVATGGAEERTGQSVNNEDEVAEAACCGDNVDALCGKESNQNLNKSQETTLALSGSGGAGSSSTTQGELVPGVGARTDCGPGWRHRSSTNSSINVVNSRAPGADEIEDFLAEVETQHEQDRRRFLAKYNFDVVKDVPLPGRFEWVQLRST